MARKKSAIAGSPRRRLTPELSARIIAAIELKAAHASGDDAERLKKNLEIIKTDILLNANARKRGVKGAMIISMPLDTIAQVLELGELSYRDFVEIVMDENKNNIVDKFSGVPGAEWVSYELPTLNLREFVALYNSAEDGTKAEIKELIFSLMPNYTEDFMNSMQDIFWAHRNIRDSIEDEDEAEKLIDNPYIRVKNLVKFKLYSSSEYAERKQYQDDYKIITDKDTRPNFWIYTFNMVTEVTSMAKTTPHWFMFGDREAAIIMDNPEDEFVLDRFSFLVESKQDIVLQTLKNLQSNTESL